MLRHPVLVAEENVCGIFTTSTTTEEDDDNNGNENFGIIIIVVFGYTVQDLQLGR
jgi:hypothetical protein